MAWTLSIGDKELSSWSMRPWLALKHAGAPFEERMIRLNREETLREIDSLSPSGKVPVLDADGLVVWDSLAICEFTAERFPQARLWPEDESKRAQARAAAAQMHAGFPSLRGECPMRVTHREQLDVTPITGNDLRRLTTLLETLRRRFAADGPYLCGEWSIADAFFTPVATRVRTYDLRLSDFGDNGEAGEYLGALLETPEFLEWERGAAAEMAAA